MRFGGPFPAVLLIGGVACGAPASAADVSPVGAWTVVAYYAQDPQTGKITYPFGENVSGAAIYSARGRMSVFVAGRDRATAPAGDTQRDAARARLWESMYAYTGTYSVAGDKVTIHVDAAWQPDWVGTDKVRRLTLEGDTLTITTLPMQSPVDGRTYISVTKFRRAE